MENYHKNELEKMDIFKDDIITITLKQNIAHTKTLNLNIDSIKEIKQFLNDLEKHLKTIKK